MKRYLLALSLVAMLGLCGLPSHAGAEEPDLIPEAVAENQYSYYDEYDETQSNPLRVAAYVLHPVGYALEWIIFRPFHYFVSMPYVAEATGHHPHGQKVVY